MKNTNGQFRSREEIELPIGFDEAPAPVQLALLKTYPSETLVDAIRTELGQEDFYSSQSLRKNDKAGILLRLWDYRQMVNESGEDVEELEDDEPTENGSVTVDLSDGPAVGSKGRNALIALGRAMQAYDEWLTTEDVRNRLDVSTDLTNNIGPLPSSYPELVEKRDHPTDNRKQYRVTPDVWREIAAAEVVE